MVEPTPTYRPGIVELKSLLLYNYEGKFLDIRHLCLEFNMYYDLFGKGIKLELVMADSNGLIEMVPIVGDEAIFISFKTPLFDGRTKKKFENTLNHVFQVYRVSDRKKLESRFETYVIHATSQEIINNSRKSIDRAYTDLPAKKIIENLYNDFLSPTEEEFVIFRENKELDVLETNGNRSFLFPDWKPLTAINYVLQEAEAANTVSESSNFVFYEDNAGWKTRVLDELLLQEPVEDFYFSEGANELIPSDGDNPIRRDQQITSLEFLQGFDVLKGYQKGLYTHRVNTIDTIKKKYVEDLFTYETGKEKIGSLEPGETLYSNTSYRSANTETSVRYFLPSAIGENYSNTAYFGNARLSDAYLRNPRKLHKNLKYKVVSAAQTTQNVLKITVPGNTDLEVGQVINVHIPQTSQNVEYIRKLNLLYDKKFLITSMRHFYNKKDNNFVTVLELIKDRYAKEIESE